MTYRTHIAAGLFTGLLLSEFYQEPLHKVLFVGAAAVGSLLPDVDCKNSYIRRYIPLFPHMKHRGHTHSVVGFLVFSLILIPFGTAAPVLGLIWGYMSHLLADSFTVYGIYVFYPRQEHRLRLGTIRTGGPGEVLFMLLMVFGIIIYFELKLRGNI